MKKLNSLIFIGLISIYSLTAQQKNANFDSNFNKAEEIFSEVYQDGKGQVLSNSKEGYAQALPIFLDLYSQDPENKNLAFKIGVSHLSSRKLRVKAIPYFEEAATSISDKYDGSSPKETNAPFITHKFLGDAYHLNSQFENAIKSYENFLAIANTSKTSDKALIAETNRKIAMCHTGIGLMNHPVKVEIKNLGDQVNSPYADYSIVLRADGKTLFFTSRRPDTKGNQKDADGNYMEDIYTSAKTSKGWSKAENIGVPINTEWHEATVGISPDAQTILIYKDDNGDGNIYTTSLKGDKWSNPVKLNNHINTKHWEPSAFISADGSTLYFTSDKPGGFGGRDIYISKRSVGGDWEKAVNMGPNINTEYDEDAPFIHPDGVTLMFSSNGHNTMGGFDIFTSLQSSDDIWSQPINVGYPINTPDDDVFYVVSPDGLNAYFSSFREGGLGEKDNYQLTYLNRKKVPLTLVQGIVTDQSGVPAKNVSITVTDNETEQIVGVYTTNEKTGEFLFILTPGKNYNITYQAAERLFYSDNIEIPKESNYYELKKEISLNDIVVGSIITLNNIFFDFDKSTLRPLSNVEVRNLVQLLKSNPNLKVEISGHTDSKGSHKYNMKLSEERAQAVVSKLIANGIDANRMTAKGYGKTLPAATNKNARGGDNPEGRQLNRRVELKITEIN